MKHKKRAITGVILAGGQARRMGGVDKGLTLFARRPLVEWVIAALAPQVDTLLISANRHLDVYAAYGFPVVTDIEPGFQGPLAGVFSAMSAAQTEWILTAPCDGPQLPLDLCGRLADARVKQDAELAVVTDGARIQPLYALLPVALADSLGAFLAGGERQARRWLSQHRVALADFSDQPECFANLNSPAEASELERDFIRSLPTR